MGRRSLMGMEVPIIASDSVKWVELSVLSSSSCAIDAAAAAAADSIAFAPLTEDYSSCSIIGDPPTYFFWRIHKSLPYALELVELRANKEFPTTGLRILFPDALCPFAYICKDEIRSTSKDMYLLYALTVSGVAYLLKLGDISVYASSFIFAQSEYLECNLQTHPNKVHVTAVAASTGCLLVGREDGSVSSFQLGVLDQSAPGFVHELRDDTGFGRLWGIVSRGRAVGAVQDLVMKELHGKKLLYVLHLDGSLRVWDLSGRNRVFSHSMNFPTLAGCTFLRLWIGEADLKTSTIPLAILCRDSSEVGWEMITISRLQYNLGDRIILSLEPYIRNIPLEEGGFINVQLTSDRIWLLNEDGLISYDLCSTNENAEEAHCYAMQEAFVADQLFQSSEHTFNDLICITHSVFSSCKDQIVPFAASTFLRRLLHPGVYQSNVLRATLQEYHKHYTDSEIQPMTVEGLKKEILSVIEHEAVTENPISTFYCWRNFCTCYFHHWRKSSAPFHLFLDSSKGAFGLIRKSSISLFRNMEDIELLIYGFFDEDGDFMSSGLSLSDNDLEHEILIDVLRCISSLGRQLGKASSALFYESLISGPIISLEEIVPSLLKIIETGYGSSIVELHKKELGADIALEKEHVDHKSLRKFSIDMLLSLHTLSNKATSWGRVLNVIEGYLKYFVPGKFMQKLNSKIMVCNMNNATLVQATAQVAKVMFESALDVLLLLSYLVNIAGQVHMIHHDILRIQLELVPMIQEIVVEWLIIHFFAITPSELPYIEDFSSQLSSLQIDSNTDNRSLKKKLGRCDFTLAFILLSNVENSYIDAQGCLPNPNNIVSLVRDFTSWMIWGRSGENESLSFFPHSTELALILFMHGQYTAVEYLLTTVDGHSRRERISQSVQSNDGDWCILHHILGCCLLVQAQSRLNGTLKERKVGEAIRSFFRASSGQGASQALQSLSSEAGLPHLGFSGCMSDASWKLHYYQWAMQIFEQYGISEGACQFGLAALEQVDEALSDAEDSLDEPAIAVKGRLWANVFKFTLDLNHYYDAYCAIISNPDDESKYICLRRFLIVLYERGAMKFLCDGQLPFIGLTEKVERELAWKAERSDISAKPNVYKFLYAFEMHRHNWRRAATYIYLYASRLRVEVATKDMRHLSLALQERLDGLSAAINALHLVHPAYAWMDSLLDGGSRHNEHYTSKKARKTVEEPSGGDVQPRRLQSYVDIGKLENEFVLTSAEYLLSLKNVKLTSSGNSKLPSELVGLLMQANLYDMAFTVRLKFWKGSELKRELERVFIDMSLKCCPSRVGSPLVGSDFRKHGLLLTSTVDDVGLHGPHDMPLSTQQHIGNSRWEELELYLGRYNRFHGRLPVVVAETLLHSDPQIELPLWLVNMFKGGRRANTWGMSGQESNPASLLRLYVDYGRYTEATNLLLEYIEQLASMRPSDIIHRKKPCSVWFPYTIIERLWCQLEELINKGHMTDQCHKLKKLLHDALLRHLKLLKVDSEDVVSSATC